MYEVISCKLFPFNVLLKDKGRSTCNLFNYGITVLFKAFAEDAYSCNGFDFSDEENMLAYLSCPLQSHLLTGICSACVCPYLDLFFKGRKELNKFGI